MVDMATLYVRDVPPELYAELKAWAEKSGRSVNAEMLALLEREAERRGTTSDWFKRLEAAQKNYPLHGEFDSVAVLRADRDRGHEPESGY
jgi:hypothetical protein